MKFIVFQLEKPSGHKTIHLLKDQFANHQIQVSAYMEQLHELKLTEYMPNKHDLRKLYDQVDIVYLMVCRSSDLSFSKSFNREQEQLHCCTPVLLWISLLNQCILAANPF